MNWINSKFNKSNKHATSSTNDELNSIYHEKQVKELCALHALNNLFQKSEVAIATMAYRRPAALPVCETNQSPLILPPNNKVRSS